MWKLSRMVLGGRMGQDEAGGTLLEELIMILCVAPPAIQSYAKPRSFSAFIISTKVRSEVSFISPFFWLPFVLGNVIIATKVQSEVYFICRLFVVKGKAFLSYRMRHVIHMTTYSWCPWKDVRL